MCLSPVEDRDLLVISNVITDHRSNFQIEQLAHLGEVLPNMAPVAQTREVTAMYNTPTTSALPVKHCRVRFSSREADADQSGRVRLLPRLSRRPHTAKPSLEPPNLSVWKLYSLITSKYLPVEMSFFSRRCTSASTSSTCLFARHAVLWHPRGRRASLLHEVAWPHTRILLLPS